jgi:hypothetical protein
MVKAMMLNFPGLKKKHPKARAERVYNDESASGAF